MPVGSAVAQAGAGLQSQEMQHKKDPLRMFGSHCRLLLKQSTQEKDLMHSLSILIIAYARGLLSGTRVSTASSLPTVVRKHRA